MVSRLEYDEMGIDGKREAAVGVDGILHVTELARHAPAVPDAAPERALPVGIHESGRVEERLADGIPHVRAQQRDAGAGRRRPPEEHAEPARAALELGALPLALRDAQDGRAHGDYHHGVQPGHLRQVRRLCQDVP